MTIFPQVSAVINEAGCTKCTPAPYSTGSPTSRTPEWYEVVLKLGASSVKCFFPMSMFAEMLAHFPANKELLQFTQGR